ncbi:MAG: KEOPS complex N(6)-L-threonylcarbamoyladenine synthase Kae1 [Candidatus Nanoarchaeia archaeon]
MLCLGIESTAHTFGVSLVTSDGEVLSNVRKLYTTTKGGLVPAKLGDHHVDICDDILQQALTVAQKKPSDIDIISFSQSPGMGHSLRVGLALAKSLALLLHVPLVGVNHCIAHLEIGRLKAKPVGELPNSDSCMDPVLLYASGANTQIIAYEGKKYRIFGETLDNGIGNFLDGFARYAGLGFPGGPKIQELAKKADSFIQLPYVVKGMDVSFSGLQTRLKQLFDSGKYTLENLCFSLQETAFAMLLEVAERALAHTQKKQLLLGGGVACNTRLQEMARIMCKERGATCFVLPNEFNIDNAAMIAWTGILQFQAGDTINPTTARIQPYVRTDDVDVVWRE